jgi:hypothetical protein
VRDVTLRVMLAPMTPCSTVPMAAMDVEEPRVSAMGIAIGRVMNLGASPSPTCRRHDIRIGVHDASMLWSNLTWGGRERAREKRTVEMKLTTVVMTAPPAMGRAILRSSCLCSKSLRTKGGNTVSKRRDAPSSDRVSN